MNGEIDTDLTLFIECLRGRLKAGAREYGNTSFERPVHELIGEAMEEAIDICGWSFLAWLRLSRLREAIQYIEQQRGTSG